MRCVLHVFYQEITSNLDTQHAIACRVWDNTIYAVLSEHGYTDRSKMVKDCLDCAIRNFGAYSASARSDHAEKTGRDVWRTTIS